ncbi:MAG TPA: ABC transporter ATP-binding protein [Acidimicrobiales bacterium]|nr:ABC transporter ATP-binding protein [Acidimicrobiales bacterium]
MTQALRVDGLRKSYGALKAVDDISFDVERGEIFALLGPNGAGKTTSIEVLEGFLKRDGGGVEVLGVDPGDRRHLRWLRDRIGVVLQELAVESFFTVRQVLERNAGFYPNPRPIDQVIELVGLSDKGDAKVKRLSGGQQRRLDIGLGIVGNPELLFLDEPTTGLDPAARRTTWDLIRLLSSEGTTVLMSSHYMDEVEALAHRVAVLSRGHIAAQGPTASLGGRNEGEVTIRFLPPPGVEMADLPITPSRVEGGVVEVKSRDEVAALHTLTGWAIDHDVALAGLSVTRETLEDIYLALTRRDRDESEGRSS